MADMDIPSPINWKIAGNPLNWLIVLSVLLVAGFALDITVRFMQNHPAFSN
jgi:hypothetical protein